MILCLAESFPASTSGRKGMNYFCFMTDLLIVLMLRYEKKKERKKHCFSSLPTLHPNMSEMVLLVHATLQWHNIGETQSKFLMLGDMLSVPRLLRSVSDRTGPWRVLPHTLADDWSWHAPSSLGSVRASLRALSGLAEREAERGAPEQPCCLWRALHWEGWRWKRGGEEEKD